MKITTPSATLEKRPDGIIEFEYRGSENKEQAQEVLDALKELSGGKKRGLICHMGSRYMSKNVINYYKENMLEMVGCAIITKSFGAKMLGNLFLGLLNDNITVKIFTKQDEAESWISDLVKDYKQI